MKTWGSGPHDPGEHVLEAVPWAAIAARTAPVWSTVLFRALAGLSTRTYPALGRHPLTLTYNHTVALHDGRARFGRQGLAC